MMVQSCAPRQGNEAPTSHNQRLYERLHALPVGEELFGELGYNNHMHMRLLHADIKQLLPRLSPPFGYNVQFNTMGYLMTAAPIWNGEVSRLAYLFL